MSELNLFLLTKSIFWTSFLAFSIVVSYSISFCSATDFNFYTKRGLLAAVYSSTLLVWLDDRSEGCADTWAFLDRRIANVMKVPKIQARLEEAFSRLPNPLSALRRVRQAVLR